jgi:DNA polymerase-3 subunit alpha
VPVVAIVKNQDKRYFVRFGPQFRVQDYQATVNALNKAGFQARTTALVSA